MSDWAQWTGCALGLLGAFLLATNSRYSRWGWIAFLLSNGAWIAYSLLVSANGLLLQQVGFTITSLIGVRQWFFAPKPNGAHR
jgi:hypothetical protein